MPIPGGQGILLRVGAVIYGWCIASVAFQGCIHSFGSGGRRQWSSLLTRKKSVSLDPIVNSKCDVVADEQNCRRENVEGIMLSPC
nr:hypothetical protein CFP56_01095 [Quercus suber]